MDINVKSIRALMMNCRAEEKALSEAKLEKLRAKTREKWWLRDRALKQIKKTASNQDSSCKIDLTFYCAFFGTEAMIVLYEDLLRKGFEVDYYYWPTASLSVSW